MSEGTRERRQSSDRQRRTATPQHACRPATALHTGDRTAARHGPATTRLHVPAEGVPSPSLKRRHRSECSATNVPKILQGWQQQQPSYSENLLICMIALQGRYLISVLQLKRPGLGRAGSQSLVLSPPPPTPIVPSASPQGPWSFHYTVLHSKMETITHGYSIFS